MKIALFCLDYIQAIIELIYPPYCLLCKQLLKEQEEEICLKCYHDLPRTNLQHVKDNSIEKIFWGRTPVCRATSFLYFAKGGHVQRIIHHLKYRKNQRVGHLMGQFYGSNLLDTAFQEADIIIPVPLHPKKLKTRGYNQSEIIAQGMASVLNIPLETDYLYRSEDTATQTKKTRISRWFNVENVFYIKNRENLTGKKILLVDDVITTGATMEAIIQKLNEIEGTQIFVATLTAAET